jgi:outer membrane protein
MKISRLLLCFCLTLGVAATAVAADDVKPAPADTGKPEIKLGSVDFRKVALESGAGKKAAALLKEMSEKYQTKLNAKAKELEKMKKSLEEKAQSLSQAKLQAKEKELQKKFKEYQEFGKSAELELQKKEAELTDQIGEKLLKLVKEYGSKNGYVAIFRKDTMMYNDTKYEPKDLTDEVLKLVNAADPK